MEKKWCAIPLNIKINVCPTGDLTGSKIANKIQKSQERKVIEKLEKSSETVTNEHHKKYLKKDKYLQKKKNVRTIW